MEWTRQCLHRDPVVHRRRWVAEANVPGIARFSFKGDLKAALIRDPVVKQRIQAHLRGHLAALAEDLELFRGQILDRLRGKYGDDIKVVLVIDSLERLRGSGEASDDVFSSVRAMFSQYPA